MDDSESVALKGRRALKDDAREYLRRWIVTGRIAPGQRIVETEVARKLGVSQGTVREALRGLEEEGLVRLIPFRGALATELVPLEIYHTFRLRTQIECDSLELTLPNFSEERIQLLEQIIQHMWEATDQTAYEIQSRWDVAFHHQLVMWTGVSVYDRVWRALESHVQRFITLVHPTFFSNNRVFVIQQHEELLKIFRSQSVAAAKAAMQEHIMLIWRINGDELLKKPVLDLSELTTYAAAIGRASPASRT
ncbi:MAG: GntR family transcriptional regulator [Firmicutes bacterium]|nr:GntR family transcriptional regulator [Bacillota bacterium]